MKKYVLAVALFALSFSAFAAGSDYEMDSRHQGMKGTPFKEGQAVALPAIFAYQLRTILYQCVVEVQGAKDGYSIVYGPKVLPACAGIIQIKHDNTAFSDLAWVNVYGTKVLAKTFDGLHSEGGNEFDVAVYTAQGARVGLHTGIYSAGNALTGLAALAGIQQYVVMQKQAYDLLPRAL